LANEMVAGLTYQNIITIEPGKRGGRPGRASL
jgi:uncharacterized protein (DUF433 family)